MFYLTNMKTGQIVKVKTVNDAYEIAEKWLALGQGVESYYVK